MTDNKIEEIIQEKGLYKPRITPETIADVIVSEQYHVFENTSLTVCCLTLKNGFAVIGESSCIHPENFDPELGQILAKINATDKIWMLESYWLKHILSKKGGYMDRNKKVHRNVPLAEIAEYVYDVNSEEITEDKNQYVLNILKGLSPGCDL